MGAKRNGANKLTVRKRRGVPGDGTPGPGRPKGSKNKLTKEGLLAAKDAFSPINERALELMRRHLDFHLAAQNLIIELLSTGAAGEQLLVLLQLDADMMRGNCSTCRHIFTLSSEYTYGKPTQRVEFSIEDYVHELREKHPSLDDDAANVIAHRAQEFWQRTG